MNQKVTYFFEEHVTCVLIGETAHILRDRENSLSRYHLRGPGFLGRYCCQGSCCDNGLQDDVLGVVESAKNVGATTVVLRKSGQGKSPDEIAGLPVYDVPQVMPHFVVEDWRIVDRL